MCQTLSRDQSEPVRLPRIVTKSAQDMEHALWLLQGYRRYVSNEDSGAETTRFWPGDARGDVGCLEHTDVQPVTMWLKCNKDVN